MKAWALSLALMSMLLQRAPSDTAFLSGIVVELGTNKPIEDVQIEVSALRLDPPLSTGAFKKLKATTDENGRFEIGDLPPGRFRIHWERSGYFPPPRSATDDDLGITTRTNSPFLNVYSKRDERAWQVSNSALDVDVRAKQQVSAISLPLIPGGVITGRVLNTRGQPLAAGRITALGISYESGYPILKPARMVLANDRGNFRLYGLQPGDYFIRAEYKASDGQEPLQYTYFPGVTNPDAATMVSVRSSTDVRGIDFSAQPGVARISGSLAITPPSLAGKRRTTPDGSPLPYFTQYGLVPLHPQSVVDVEAVLAYSVSSVTSALLDRFELRGVRPGNYALYAVLDPEDEEDIVGRTTVQVGTQDVENVSIILAAPSEVQGRIVPVENAVLPMEKLGVFFRLQAGVFPESQSLQSWKTPNAEGGFRFSGLPGVRYDLTVTRLPAGTAVVDVRQGETSVFDEGVQAHAGAAPIEVLVSRALGTVEVSVTDAKRKLFPDAIVALVPNSGRARNPSLYQRAQFDVARSRYTFDAVVPGDYRLYAWDYIPNEAEMNANFLRKFESQGIVVNVQSGKTSTIEVPVIITQE